MEKTKLRYEVPEAETFVVRFEGMVCTSPGDYNPNGTQKGRAVTNDWDWDDEE